MDEDEAGVMIDPVRAAQESVRIVTLDETIRWIAIRSTVVLRKSTLRYFSSNSWRPMLLDYDCDCGPGAIVGLVMKAFPIRSRFSVF